MTAPAMTAPAMTALPSPGILLPPGHASASLLLGLIGRGIQRSRTPYLHEEEGRAQGISVCYRLLDLDRAPDGLAERPDLGALLRLLAWAGFGGLNVTHPFKQVVLPHLRGLSEDARRLGAVNTLCREGEGWRGENTDWSGFAAAFGEELRDVPRHHVVQLGAGGAGAAVAYALLKLGVERLDLIDVERARAEALVARLAPFFPATRLGAFTPDALPARLAEASGLVNTTPVGMTGHEGLPLDPALIAPPLWVADVIYFPLETALLRTARARGLRTMNGAGMAIHQAAQAFTLFTGRAADIARLRALFARFDAPA
jgi:shikimate dehydrogenase